MNKNFIEAKGHISYSVRSIFQKHQDEVLQSNSNGEVITAHFGSFSQGFIYTLTNELEELLISNRDKRSVVKRLFSILIEGLQNLRIHGKKDEFDRQVGFLLIVRYKDRYQLRMANLIEDEEQERLEEYLKNINKCSEDDLNQTYLDILRRDFMSQSKGAGLGFVTTILKADSKINYSIHKVSESKSLFNFAVDLLR